MRTMMSMIFLVLVLGTLSGCGRARYQVAVVPPEQPCNQQWVHMPMLINFPTGGTVIDSENRMILEEMVRSASVRTALRRVRVEGHTDSCGSEMNNMVLSQNRAISVANELVAMGVPREAIDTTGFGSTQPIATEACGRNEGLSERTNRRVEFSLLVCR